MSPGGHKLIGVADALRVLKNSEQVSYVLDSSLRLAYHNKAWDKFAQDNSAPELVGAAVIGISLFDVIDESLRPFYTDAFHRVRQDRIVWDWVYECSSPESFRKFLMRVHLIEPDGWLLVTNHLLVEGGHSAQSDSNETYVGGDGQIRVCVHCRCSKRVAPPERWDFVPANLKSKLENVTHGLCPTCREYFYPPHKA